MKEVQAIVRALSAPGALESVLATLVKVDGSSYRRPGARLLMTKMGMRLGSISGGCLEEDVLVRVRNVFATGAAEKVVYDTTSENDLVWGVGLGCHGVVSVLLEKLPPRPSWAVALAQNMTARRPTDLSIVYRANEPGQLGTHLGHLTGKAGESDVFFETVAPPPALLICGAGDDAQPLARLAKELGWHVTVADPRAAFVTAERFPEADSLLVATADELVARAAPGPDALVVVMTHRYVHDVPVLRELLRRPLGYLGLLGPKQRGDRILQDLSHEGLAPTPEQRARLHAPVGLDIGADTPEEVALAIVAEIHTVLSRRDGRPLRERTRPIHG